MGWDGAGNYTRAQNFSADASANIKILASRVDSEFDDMASAFSNVLTRDGQNAPTANLPMGGFRHVNVGAPTSARNYIRVQDIINNIPIYMVDSEASADRISVSALYFTTASAATAPSDGVKVIIKAGSDKSSAVAIRLNTGDGNPHSANVILTNSSAIYSGAIRSGGIYEFVYSSSDTAWQILNPQVDYATSAYPGVVLFATDAEVAAGTAIDHAVTPNQLADKFSADYATTASAGLIELATTAEAIAGTNVSAAITPSTLAATSTNASVGGTGLIELATTAEVFSVSDATRAVTPAALNPLIPYVSKAICAVTSASVTIVPFIKTSGWAISSDAANGRYEVIHNISVSSEQLAISYGVETDISALYVRVQSASVSSFIIQFTNASGVQAAGSATVNIVVYLRPT